MHALLPCGDLVYCLICDFLVTAVIFITNHIRGRWFVYVDISIPMSIERCASLHSIFADTFDIVLIDYFRYGCRVETFKVFAMTRQARETKVGSRTNESI